MPRSPMSSDSLTEPSPSPPPVSRKTSTNSAAGTKVSGLDSGSELSDLTDDEQDNDGRDRRESSIQQVVRRQGKKRREDEGTSTPVAITSSHPAPLQNGHHDVGTSNGTKILVSPSLGQDGPAERERLPDGDDDLSTVEDPESEEEVDEEQDVPSLKRSAREVSVDLTDVDEPDVAQSPGQPDVESEDDSGTESATDNEGENEDVEEEEDEEVEEEDEDEEDEAASSGPVDVGADDEPLDDVDMEPDLPVPVVPLVPAAVSIMAGQTLIKTPSPSPSTSPEPEEMPVKTNLQDGVEELMGEAYEQDADLLRMTGPNADLEVEMDAEEEADLDMQPAHRAEALDVLAGIELKFALLRERLYVEKMEDLAEEESMILQDNHPEMISLQTELQKRHDRRLELALKRRRYEENNVNIKRTADEDGIWTWWKFERDSLQTDMLAETHRKRRKVQREQRLIDRPLPVRRIPLPPPLGSHPEPISLRGILQSTPFDNAVSHSKSKRKQKESSVTATIYPNLTTLSSSEIRNDVQFLTARRGFHPHMPESAMVMHHFDQQYGDPPMYSHAQNMQGQPLPFVQGPSSSIHPYRPYDSLPPPPMGNLHQSKDYFGRPIPGPGQPSGYAPPRPSFGGFVGPSSSHQPINRRSPSPGRAPAYGHGAMNGAGTSTQHLANTADGGPHAWSAGGMVGPGGVKAPLSNGWKKESKKGLAIGLADGRDHDIEREADRDRDGGWLENGKRDSQGDDPGRPQLAPPIHIQQSRQPHRHSIQHQLLQDTPHHHHVVHRHHHHLSPRSGTQTLAPLRHEPERHMSASEFDSLGRRGAPTVETINLVPKYASSSTSSMLWKNEDADHARDRDRPQMLATSPNLGPSSSFPDRFVMTSSQAIKLDLAGQSRTGPSRHDSWVEDGHRRPPPPTVGPGQGPNVMPAGPSFDRSPPHPPQRSIQPSPQHPDGFSTHSHLGTHRLPSPRRLIPPSSPRAASASHMSSPGRLPLPSGPTIHHSGRLSPRPPRPLSPLPLKTTSLSTASSYPFSPPPIGPGAIPLNHARLVNGTSGRIDALTLDDHGPGSRGLFHSPHLGTVSTSSHLGGPDSPHLPPPPKMSVVQLQSSS